MERAGKERGPLFGAGLCSEETGRISCSVKRETLPEGLPPIDPALLPPFSLLDRFSCRSSVFLPFLAFPIILYIYTVKRRESRRMRRGCALSTPFSSCFFTPSPYPSVLSPSHCSRGKPIAGNTSLGSDRKEGRKEGKSRNRGIVTTPLPRARPLCRSCCSFGGGADVARRRGRRRSAGECSITPDFFFLRRPLAHSLAYAYTRLISHVSSLQPRRASSTQNSPYITKLAVTSATGRLYPALPRTSPTPPIPFPVSPPLPVHPLYAGLLMRPAPRAN